jgi:hypothetical protein
MQETTMEIHRVGPFTDVQQDSTRAAEKSSQLVQESGEEPPKEVQSNHSEPTAVDVQSIEETLVARGETTTPGVRLEERAQALENASMGAGSEPSARLVEVRLAESHLNAQFLKARLLSSCDGISADNPVRSEPESTVSGGAGSGTSTAEQNLAKEISDYLQQHPNAEDTLEDRNDWSRQYEAMPGLDARGEAVAIDTATVRTEGWPPDAGQTAGSSRASEGTSVESGADNSADPTESQKPATSHPTIGRKRHG